MALPKEPVATKFSCGFLADGGGGDPLALQYCETNEDAEFFSRFN